MFKCHVFRWYKLNFNPLVIYTFLFEISKLHFGTSLFCHSLNIFEARGGLAILPLISSQQFFSQNYVIITKLPPLKFAFYFIKRTKAINKHLFNKYALNIHYESQSVLSVKIQWLGDIGKQAPIINCSLPYEWITSKLCMHTNRLADVWFFTALARRTECLGVFPVTDWQVQKLDSIWFKNSKISVIVNIFCIFIECQVLFCILFWV